jgi:hypothetical protein
MAGSRRMMLARSQTEHRDGPTCKLVYACHECHSGLLVQAGFFHRSRALVALVGAVLTDQAWPTPLGVPL